MYREAGRVHTSARSGVFQRENRRVTALSPGCHVCHTTPAQLSVYAWTPTELATGVSVEASGARRRHVWRVVARGD